MSPSSLMTMPDPAPSKTPREVLARVSMATTDGWTLARMPWMSRPPSLVVTGVTDGVVRVLEGASSSRATVTPVATTADITAPARPPISAARRVVVGRSALGVGAGAAASEPVEPGQAGGERESGGGGKGGGERMN